MISRRIWCWSCDRNQKSISDELFHTQSNPGHGIGHALHEDPQIPNFRQKRKGIRLMPGMTLAIEPMINIGRPDVEWLDDDWTVVTEDGSLSAHYENTILINEEGEPDILTLGHV